MVLGHRAGRDLGGRVGWVHLLLADRRAPGQHPGARARSSCRWRRSRRSGTTQRRVTLTTRGVVALGVTPVSALAGVLLGAEELVLASIALCLLLAGGLGQCAYRAARDRDVWRVGVDLGASDTEVGGLLAVRVTVGSSGGATTPVWLEAPELSWVPRTGLEGHRPLPSPTLVRRVPPLDERRHRDVLLRGPHLEPRRLHPAAAPAVVRRQLRPRGPAW